MTTKKEADTLKILRGFPPHCAYQSLLCMYLSIIRFYKNLIRIKKSKLILCNFFYKFLCLNVLFIFFKFFLPLLLLMGVMITAPANNFERHMLPVAFVFGFVVLTFWRESQRARRNADIR